MSNIKVKVTVPKVADVKARLAKLHSPDFVNKVNTEAVGEMKRLIAAGVSPVKGKRYVNYKAPNEYPGKEKPKRPVNLFLTGAMLSNLIAFISPGGRSLKIGISPNAPADVKVYAEANNVGTKFIPARRFVPLGGETWTVSIMRKLKDLYAKRIQELFK